MENMETVEPVTSASSNGVDPVTVEKQPGANGVSNDEEPSTSDGADEIVPREVTFDQFVETCLALVADEANPVEKIKAQVDSLKEKNSNSQVWKNSALNQILSHFDYCLRIEPDPNARHLLFYDFKSEFKRLDKYLSTLKNKPKSERNKLMKKVKDLQTLIKKDLRKIDRLDQEELSIDDLDNEDNAYLKKGKYEKRVVTRARKLFALQGMAKTSLRLLDKVFKYNKTPYPAVNEAISAKYRAIMQKKYRNSAQRPANSTPNLSDVTEIIKTVCSEHKLIIPDIDDLAWRVTKDIVKEVSRRREIEFDEMMNEYEFDSHLRPEEVADLSDVELIKALESNEVLNRERLTAVIDNFGVTLKEKGLESTDIGGEGTTSDDDEDDEDDDEEEEDGNEIGEGAEASDDGGDSEDEPGESVIDDDEDCPIVLDSEMPQNGEAEASSSTENKKRSIDSDTLIGNDKDDQSKKIKTDVNQAEFEPPEVSSMDSKPGKETAQGTKLESSQESISSCSKSPEKPNIPIEPGDRIAGEKCEQNEPKNCEPNVSEEKPSSTSELINVSSENVTPSKPSLKSEDEDESIKIVYQDIGDQIQGGQEDDDDDVICLD